MTRREYDCISCGPFNVCSCFQPPTNQILFQTCPKCHQPLGMCACKKVDDMVTHPKHYTWLKDKCGVEVWDITQWLPGNLANVVKYVLRADLKGAQLEDLKKAQQYLQHEIDRLS